MRKYEINNPQQETSLAYNEVITRKITQIDK